MAPTPADLVHLVPRVHAGMRWLDEQFPEGWKHRVNPRTLDMSSSTHCVLGQLFSDYCEGESQLVPSEADAWWYQSLPAFSTGNAEYTQQLLASMLGFTININTSESYETLTELWRSVLFEEVR